MQKILPFFRDSRAKITLQWCPKVTFFFVCKLKSQYYDVQKSSKKHVFKACRSQNHTTMMPKNLDFFDF